MRQPMQMYQGDLVMIDYRTGPRLCRRPDAPQEFNMTDDAKPARPSPPRIYQTAGGAISPNCFLELISSDQQHLEWLVLEGNSLSRKRVLACREGIYEPISLDPTVRHAIYFPTSVADVKKPRELVDLLSEVLQKHLEPEEQDDLLCLAVWAVSSWLWDFLPAPITLLISGDASHAFALLSLLSACTRRALCLADVSVSALRRLPVQIGPTILVNRADLSSKVRAALRFGNLPGFVIPGSGTSLTSIAGPRALFIGDDAPDEGWTENVLHVSLPQRWQPRYWLTASQLIEIREKVQPLALGYRLSYWTTIRSQGTLDPPSDSELTRALLACVPGDEELEQRLSSILERREVFGPQANPLDPNRALVECLWGPVHEGNTISSTSLTGRLNALLRSRGEVRDFNSIEVGWRLQKLGVPRDRGQRGMHVKGTKGLIQHLHMLARRFDLALPEHDTCTECISQASKANAVAGAEPQVPVEAVDM